MNSSKTPGSSPSNRPAAELEARIEEALGLHQAGQLGPAEAIYREVLEREPDHPQALHLNGVVSLQMGRPDNAVGFIERALAVNPDDAEAWNNLGQAYESLERTGDAGRPARTGCPFPFVRRSPVRPPLRHRYANGVVPVLRLVLGARTTR